MWDSFMVEVQRLGADPAAQLRSRHAKLMSGGQGCSVLQHGMRQEFLRAEGAAANFGQWAGEVLAELHAQEVLAHAALTESWGRRWTALLV